MRTPVICAVLAALATRTAWSSDAPSIQSKSAVVLDAATGMSPDDLVAAMNAVARQLHLKHTRFTDPTGLGGNVSTAREMAIALRAVLEDDVLRAIMRQDSADVVSKDHYSRIHYSSTNQ